MSICISDVNRNTEGWLFHLFCSNLHRQFSMVPMTGSHQCGGRPLPAPLFYFRPEAHGKAISRPFPVGLRKQCQWFVNRCSVTRRIVKIALFLLNSLIYAFVWLVFICACRREVGGQMVFSVDALITWSFNVCLGTCCSSRTFYIFPAYYIQLY